MSIINNMKIEEILEQVDISMIYFEDIPNLVKEEFISTDNFMELYTVDRKDYSKIKKFFIENENKVDKERLLMVLIKNYQYYLEQIENKENEIYTRIKLGNSDEVDFNILTGLKVQKKEIESELKNALNLARDIDQVITYYKYNPQTNRYKIMAIDSKELIKGQKVNENKNLKRFEEIDNSLEAEETEQSIGISAILQVAVLTDFFVIFPNVKFGDDVRTMILENTALREGLANKKELEKLKSEDSKKYIEFIDNIDFELLLPETQKALKENIKYVNMDKLLITCAYRFYDNLRNVDLDLKISQSIHEILKSIRRNIKDKNIKLDDDLQKLRDGNYALERVKFTVKDLDKLINQFTEIGYIPTNKIEEYKENIDKCAINLQEIEPEYIDIIFSKEELENKALLNDENLIYISERFKWDKNKLLQNIIKKESCSNGLISILITKEKINIEDIIELYEQGVVSIDQIKALSEKIDFSEIVNSYELIQYYKNSIEEMQEEGEKEKYNKYLQLYKEIKVSDSEKLNQSSKELMMQLIENYNESDRKSYIEDIKYYYKQGLLTLSTLIEWDGEELIEELYKDSLITIETIEEIAKKYKLPFEFLSEKYLKLINDSNINYNERLKYIKSGFIDESKVLDMYQKNLVFEADMIELVSLGIVRNDSLKRVISNRDKNKLEKNTTIKLKNLNSLTKLHNNIYLDSKDKSEYNYRDDKQPKLIIDPNRREEYINLFKAYRAETDIEEESPFYNYEFYVIPDESGDIGLNSVVVAERYYDNKETEEKFALNNATYFFKYKDLLVLSNLSKSEMTKERDNIVFTAKHILATEEKNGYWAAGVLYGIVKTMLSSDLKEYSKDNQRRIVFEQLCQMYSKEEIDKILDFGKEIDIGEYTYEIEEPEDTRLRKRRKPKTIDISDNSQIR